MYIEFENKLRNRFRPLYEDVYTLLDNKLFKDERSELLQGAEEIQGQELPFLVNRNSVGVENVISWKTSMEQKGYSVEINQVMQRYIFPKGNQANILRLVFHTRNSRSSQANYAYRIKSKLRLFDPKGQHMERSVVWKNKPNTIKFTLVRGSGLRTYEGLANNVVTYLEKVTLATFLVKNLTILS